MAMDPEFRATMFADPENWQRVIGLGPPARGRLAGFARGDPLQDPQRLVCHGCPLSLAYKIIRENVLVAGAGHHYKNGRTVHGIFVTSRGSLYNRMGLARDRSTLHRDTEWNHDGPTAWSTPCVLVFPMASENLVRLSILEPYVHKSAIELPIGTRMQLPQHLMLVLWRPEYMLYQTLPAFVRGGELTEHFGKTMMCGGKEDRENGVLDPLYWSRDNNNLSPSCGKTCLVKLLHLSPSWTKTNSKIWFCSDNCRVGIPLRGNGHGWDRV